MAASDGTPGATSTGNFQVSMTVVSAAGGPSVQVSELDDFDLGGLVTQSDLTFTAFDGYVQPFCLTRSGTGSVSPRITFSQPGVGTFNSDIGSHFALVGPARAGTASGFAQVPIVVSISDPWTDGVEVMARGLPSTRPITTGETCTGGGHHSVYGTSSGAPGAPKPMIGIRRLAAADASNPTGAYSATIVVTVTAN
ncbi:MAG: hypothetical protein INE98_02475 [Phenylobacterium sp.]|nr:hypothetical protein [Phenylobacterium sp.]